jgi:hypothetical protein
VNSRNGKNNVSDIFGLHFLCYAALMEEYGCVMGEGIGDVLVDLCVW